MNGPVLGMTTVAVIVGLIVALVCGGAIAVLGAIFYAIAT